MGLKPPPFFVRNRYPDTGESGKTWDAELSVPCFRCGKSSVGRTSILTGTKDGIPLRETEVDVCERCYVLLKQKVKTRSRLSDEDVGPVKS